MTTAELQEFAQSFAAAFSRRDVDGVLEMLADDVEVFDHVPYRFDDRARFGTYFAGAVSAFEGMNFTFSQPSCRMLGDTTGIVNAYDSFTGVMKDGKVLTLYGRTTLVVGKRAGQWKIVSAHFSPLPHTS
jgi:ketosteroid isomerase-like protein